MDDGVQERLGHGQGEWWPAGEGARPSRPRKDRVAPQARRDSPGRSRRPPCRSTCRRTARSPWPGPGRPDGAGARKLRCRGTSPRLAKIIDSRAVSLQTQRSQPRASDRPAPTATPSTLAIVGLVIRCKARATSPRRRMRDSPERFGSVAGPSGSDRSAPEQKAPPAPVRTMARSSGSRLDLHEDLLELAEHLSAGRVLPLGAVHDDGDDTVLALDNQGLHARRR